MFERILLAATITFSLNLFIGIQTQSSAQRVITAQTDNPPVQVARNSGDRKFFFPLFQY